MSRYGPMRRIQRQKPQVTVPVAKPETETLPQEPIEPIKKNPKPSTGYYRYVLDLHKSVSAKFKDEDDT